VNLFKELSELPAEKAAGRLYVLPTEAQSEYTCRAGSATLFHFGEDVKALPEYGWFRLNSDGQTHPVAEKRASPWGLYDMHGNVWEWCRDWFDKDYYKTSPVDDPLGPPVGTYRAGRGGGWFYDGKGCRSAHRGLITPSDHGPDVGLRVSAIIPGRPKSAP
jgi:formylglycine-generating enzyme